MLQEGCLYRDDRPGNLSASAALRKLSAHTIACHIVVRPGATIRGKKGLRGGILKRV